MQGRRIGPESRWAGMTKPNVDTFLDLVQRSGLVEKDQLDAALSELTQQIGQPAPADADQIATHLIEAGLITRWQAERLLDGRYRGFFLGKYKLLDQLGSGGMSRVYLAEHVLMQRRVAIKVLPASRVDDTSYLARFHLRGPGGRRLGPPQYRAGLRRR